MSGPGETKKPGPCEEARFQEKDGWESGQGEELGLELVLGDVGSDDLILDLAILEEQKEGDTANAVLRRQFAGVVNVDLADLGLAFKVGGDLVDDGADHFARAAPFGPEIDEDG